MFQMSVCFLTHVNSDLSYIKIYIFGRFKTFELFFFERALWPVETGL